jgi:prepilin-type N-terminal cleavage/methylation domain-containing protein
MKTLKTLRSKFAAFTLIELLVVISIIAVLAALALPAITGALVKGQITQTMSNYRQLYLASHSCYLDGQVAGTNTGFVGTNGTISDWSNSLVPTYLSTNAFFSSLYTKQTILAAVYKTSEADNENEPMLSMGVTLTAGTPVTATIDTTSTFKGKGGCLVTVQGSAVNISGATNLINPTLANNGVSCTNSLTPVTQ